MSICAANTAARNSLGHSHKALRASGARVAPPRQHSPRPSPPPSHHAGRLRAPVRSSSTSLSRSGSSCSSRFCQGASTTGTALGTAIEVAAGKSVVRSAAGMARLLGQLHARVARGIGPHAPRGRLLPSDATSSAQKPIMRVSRCGRFSDGVSFSALPPPSPPFPRLRVALETPAGQTRCSRSPGRRAPSPALGGSPRPSPHRRPRLAYQRRR